MDKPQQHQVRYEETSGGRVKTAGLVTYGSNKPNGTPGSGANPTATGNGVIPSSIVNHANGNVNILTAGTGSTSSSVSSATGVSSSTSSYSAPSYRLASIDRLAQRHKLYEANSTNGTGATPSTAGIGDGPTSGLQSKRELFFKNDMLPAPALVTSISSNTPPTVPMKTVDLSQSTKPDILKSHSHQTTTLNGLEDNRVRLEKKNVTDDKVKQLDGYVGFANFPNQVYRKAVKKGFDFTLMVVGGAGLGKSTLINSMFLTDIYSTEFPGPSLRVKKTVQVETSRLVLKENGVNLTLTVVDTPGFGDAVDNSNCWLPVMEFIESRYEEYLNSESRVDRTKKPLIDPRVHVCLYFIAPSGHGLKSIDVELMRKLCDKVNLIPVIGKADSMTPEECAAFKKQILNELTQQKIKIYVFPNVGDDEDGKLNKQMMDRVPFAVVGSNTILEMDGKKVRGRRYPWGTVDIENIDHSDFVPLRNMVLRTHLQDLKEVTNNVHYENYRVRKLAGIGTDGKPVKGGIDKNPLAQLEEEKKARDQKLKKMELEMESVFEMKVKERKQRLIDSETDLKKRDEGLKKSLDKMKRDMDDRKKQFESDKLGWEQQSGITFDELRRRNMENLTKDLENVEVVDVGGISTPKKSKGSTVKRTKSLRSNYYQSECKTS